jgi:hypothetical protein
VCEALGTDFDALGSRREALKLENILSDGKCHGVLVMSTYVMIRLVSYSHAVNCWSRRFIRFMFAN